MWKYSVSVSHFGVWARQDFNRWWFGVDAVCVPTCTAYPHLRQFSVYLSGSLAKQSRFSIKDAHAFLKPHAGVFPLQSTLRVTVFFDIMLLIRTILRGIWNFPVLAGCWCSSVMCLLKNSTGCAVCDWLSWNKCNWEHEQGSIMTLTNDFHLIFTCYVMLDTRWASVSAPWPIWCSQSRHPCCVCTV